MKNKSNIASIKDLPAIIGTFILVLLPWTFFRAEDASQAFYIVKKIITSFSIYDIDMFYPKRLLIVFALLVFEWFHRDKEHPLCIDSFPRWMRLCVYYILILLIILFGTYNYSPFIYFKF